jgi:hypothetical protein
MMITCAALLTLFSQLLFISPASGTDILDDFVPPPADVAIDVVSVNGSGCPPGSAVAVSSHDTGFTVAYSQYLAQVGVGSAPTAFRKNCQLNVLVHVPEGYTYAITGAEHVGFAALAPGATGMQRSSYYFQGQANTAVLTHRFTGPFVDNWHTVDVTDLDSLMFHPCGALRSLNINTELRVMAGTSDPTTTTSFLVMDSTHSSTYDIQWRHCP